MSLRPGLLLLTLNLALVIQCLSRNNNFFLQFYMRRNFFSRTPEGYAYTMLKTIALAHKRDCIRKKNLNEAQQFPLRNSLTHDEDNIVRNM
jgi:hypothetical protein